MRTWNSLSLEHRPASQAHSGVGARTAYMLWSGFGAALAFAIPFIFSGLLELQHDLYYLIYFGLTLTFLAFFARGINAEPAMLIRRWQTSLTLGLIGGAITVLGILRLPATPHPGGAYFAFELVWRGVLYGVVDTLLLTVFPIAVAYGLWNHNLAGIGRKLGYGLTALLLVLSVTATYHLGYSHYRSQALVSPEIGNIMYSVPALLTLNPVGSLVWHSSVHVAAVTYQYEGNTFTPPQRAAQP